MDPIIESILEEQIASLLASAAIFDQQRGGFLASAEAASVQKAGAVARAAEIQASLDALRGQAIEPEAAE